MVVDPSILFDLSGRLLFFFLLLVLTFWLVEFFPWSLMRMLAIIVVECSDLIYAIRHTSSCYSSWYQALWIYLPIEVQRIQNINLGRSEEPVIRRHQLFSHLRVRALQHVMIFSLISAESNIRFMSLLLDCLFAWRSSQPNLLHQVKVTICIHSMRRRRSPTLAFILDHLQRWATPCIWARLGIERVLLFLPGHFDLLFIILFNLILQ